MKVINSIFSAFKRNKSFFLLFVPMILLLSVVASLVLIFPREAAYGISSGIEICLEKIIPSLFPFLFFITVLYDSGIFCSLSKITAGITAFLFNLPPIAFSVILLSLIGGYPVGATLIEKAYNDGEITISQAKRMLLFCVNPGPSFAVSALGVSIIGSFKAGIIVYASVTASALIMAFLTRYYDNERTVHPESEKAIIFNTSFSLNTSISQSVKSMVNICTCIIIFSCLSAVIKHVISSETVYTYICLFSEVTNGSMLAAEKFQLPMISAVVAFSGLCVHFQLLPVIMKLRLKYRIFLSARVISALISYVISLIFLRLFPQTDTVISFGTKPSTTTAEVPFPLCVWLLIMCGLFLIGDNYIIGKRQITKKP